MPTSQEDSRQTYLDEKSEIESYEEEVTRCYDVSDAPLDQLELLRNEYEKLRHLLRDTSQYHEQTLKAPVEKK